MVELRIGGTVGKLDHDNQPVIITNGRKINQDSKKYFYVDSVRELYYGLRQFHRARTPSFF